VLMETIGYIDDAETSENLFMPFIVAFRANESLSSEMSDKPEVKVPLLAEFPGTAGVKWTRL